MADQVTVDNGDETDYIVSTDDAGASGHVQRVKLALSADGSAAHATVDADGVLVNLGTNNDVTVTGTVTANAGTNLNTSALATSAKQDTIIGHVDGIETSLSAIQTAVETLDNTVAGNELQVDVLTMPTTTVTGTVAVTNAGLTELASAIDTEMQVDVVGALPAGNNNIGDVDVASSALPTGASTLAEQQTQTASLSVLDDWDETNRAAVNIIAGQVGVAGASGTVSALTQRVVLATDVALPAGTNAIGKLAANSGVDIGDVDITSIAAGDNNIGNVDIVTMPTVTVNAHAVTNAGTFATQVDGAALTALQVIDNPVLVDDAAFTPATSSVNMAGFQADESSTDSVDEGDAGAARMTLDRKVIVTQQPHAAGGATIFRSLDLDESEEEVKSTAGTVYGWAVTNTSTGTRWLKFYNLTAANTTVGSSTPVITWGIPGNSSDDVGANMMGGVGIAFDTAISVAATTGVADADTGAPGANDVVINIFYK